MAAEHGATVVQFYFKGTYPKKKNWALDNLPFQNHWVLIVDADEVVFRSWPRRSPAGSPAMRPKAIYLNSKYFFLGRRIRHCGYSECWNLRLFRHRLGRYEKMPGRYGRTTATTKPTSMSSCDGRLFGSAMSSSIMPIPTSPPG